MKCNDSSKSADVKTDNSLSEVHVMLLVCQVVASLPLHCELGHTKIYKMIRHTVVILISTPSN